MVAAMISISTNRKLLLIAVAESWLPCGRERTWSEGCSMNETETRFANLVSALSH